MKRTYLTAIILCTVLVTASVILNFCAPTKTLVKPPLGLVTGYVFTEVIISGEPKPRKVFLPDVIVTVRDPNQNILAIDTTDLDGGYRTRDFKKGSHTIFLSKAGFNTVNYPVTNQFATNHPGPLKITFNGSDFVYGTVKLDDGFPAVFRSEVFGVNFFTTVTVDSVLPKNSVRCNTAGEFVLRNVKRDGRFRILADCQDAKTSQVVQAGGVVHRLVFKNTKPLIQSIVAFDQGKPILRTLPSTKIKLLANTIDHEGHAITHMWKPYGEYTGSVFNSSNTAEWQLTSVKAKNTVALLVLDNNGGAAYTSYTIEDNDNKVAFSGVVQEIDGSGNIADAAVKINGTEVARSSSNGYFSVRVDEATNNRYVLNIEKAGYMLHSSIFQKEAHGQTYKLVKATIKDFDPNNDIVLQEEEDKYTKFTNFDKRQERRTRAGALVKIPGGSIVDSGGNKITSTVTVQLRTIDLYDPMGLMPGDYAALDNGVDKTIVSFGAIDVQIRDKANPDKKYNLGNNAIAGVSVPISSDILAASPATIPLWDYNETSGIWENIGSANKSGNRYEGLTKSFSSINTDVAITGGTCIFLKDNPNNPIFPGSPCDVTITVPTSGAPKIKHATISDGDQTLVIARLPLNTDITVEVKRGTTPLAARTIHTASSSSGAASDIDPANPETVCTVDVYRKDAPVADVTSTPFLGRVTTETVEQALAYYKSTGAITDINGDGNFEIGEGETFAQWKTRNGFNSGDDAHASYFNAGDLGFNRAMHQKGSGSHIAFYVSNYNNFPDAEADVFGVRTVAPGATVAMEYDINGATGARGIIKFFLFKGPGETLDTHVDLDGGGEKFIPGLCIECHGGRETDYSLLAAGNGLQNYYQVNPTHSPTFLSFDLQTFQYSSAHDRTSQENDLRNLNQRVLDANSTQGIKDFLHAAYSSPGALAGNFTDNSIAVNWNTGANHNGIDDGFFYSRVVGPSCRTCHSSKEPFPDLQFNSPTDFIGNAPDFAVCSQGPGKYMPNAEVTFKNFWNSTNPYQPEQFRLYLGLPDPCE